MNSRRVIDPCTKPSKSSSTSLGKSLALPRSIQTLLVRVLFAAMRHLSALDALFLQLETPETPMHVGSLMLLRRPARSRVPHRAIRNHLAARMHLAPVFTRKLASIPGDIANPAWLRGGEPDLDYHVRG